MKLISESDTSITSEVLLGSRPLDCTEDRKLAMPCQQMTSIAPMDMGVVRTCSQTLAAAAVLED